MDTSLRIILNILFGINIIQALSNPVIVIGHVMGWVCAIIYLNLYASEANK